MDDWQQSIRQLLGTTRIAFLSTLGETGTETSMTPYCIFEGDALLYLSALARHTTNIARDGRIGMMICTPETAGDSPLALPRISLAGEADSIPDSQIEQLRMAYLEQMPEAKPLFSFPDFRLFRMNVLQVHWIGGFGKARSISRQVWYRMFGVDLDVNGRAT